jgi:hypothetical protein
VGFKANNAKGKVMYFSVFSIDSKGNKDIQLVGRTSNAMKYNNNNYTFNVYNNVKAPSGRYYIGIYSGANIALEKYWNLKW